MSPELAGVIPALVSPLTEEGSVDAPAVSRLVEHVIAGGVSGLLALGSTGEVVSLDVRSRRQIVAAVVESCAGRVPVLCGVAQNAISDARDEITAAARLGATAALVAPPFYYPASQNVLQDFYRRLAQSSPIPVWVYNIPQFTKVVAEPETVAQLAHEGSIAGIKDSSRDFEYYEQVRIATRDIPAFRVFTGTDSMLLASLAVGGAGTICAAANVAPAWVVRVCHEFFANRLDAARRHQDALIQLVVRLRVGGVPAGFKSALACLGICGPWLAAPRRALDVGLARSICEYLGEKGLANLD
jgi:4-hydroxy-tetrahydrodipicolinate synthase